MNKTSKISYLFSGISFVLFMSLTLIIWAFYKHTGFAFDQSIQNLAFHLQSNPLLVLFFSHFTFIFGDVGGAITSIMVCLALFFIFKEKIGALWLGSVIILSIVCNTIIKSIVGRVRPDIHRLPGFFHEPGLSYASGHSTFATVLCVTLFLIFLGKMSSKKSRVFFGVLCVVVIFLVMCSRIFVGVHYPSDTLGCLLQGIMFISLTYPTYVKYQQKKTSH